MLVEHHVKYKEIHGIDETIWMEQSEHKKLHARLRREKKCRISVNLLGKISKKARTRTKQFRQYMKEIQPRIIFEETLGNNVRLRETIMYNNNTGTVSYWAKFRPNNKTWLPVVTERLIKVKVKVKLTGEI